MLLWRIREKKRNPGLKLAEQKRAYLPFNGAFYGHISHVFCFHDDTRSTAKTEK